MENHHFSWVNPLWMVIFNSYIKLPEGNTLPLSHCTWGVSGFARLRPASALDAKALRCIPWWRWRYGKAPYVWRRLYPGGRRMSPMFWPQVGEKRGLIPLTSQFSKKRPKRYIHYIPKPNPKYSLSFATKGLKSYIPKPKWCGGHSFSCILSKRPENWTARDAHVVCYFRLLGQIYSCLTSSQL